MGEKFNFDDGYIKKIYEGDKNVQPEKKKGLQIIYKKEGVDDEEVEKMANSITDIDIRESEKFDDDWIQEMKNIKFLYRALDGAKLNKILNNSKENIEKVKNLERKIQLCLTNLDAKDKVRDIYIKNLKKRKAIN